MKSNPTFEIDRYIGSLPEWQQQNLTVFRKLVHEADPTIIEDWKWSVPVFMKGSKMLFAMSAFKAHTKFNFMFNGSQLRDKHHLFNNGLESKNSRAIDLREGQTVDRTKLADLIQESLELYESTAK